MRIRKISALPLDEQLRHLNLYHWSSYRSYIGRAKPPDWLEPAPILAPCGRSKTEQRLAYRAFVENSLAEQDDELLAMLKAPALAIGSEAFVDDIRSRTINLIRAYKKQEDVSLRHTVAPVEPERVLAVVAEMLGVEPAAFLVCRRNSVLRGVAARMLCKHAGLTQRAAAKELHVGSGAAVGKQQQKLAQEMVHDRRLRRRVGEIEIRLAALCQP